MWELFPFPDETDLETYTSGYLKGVLIAGVLVLIVLTVGVLMSASFGRHQSTSSRHRPSDVLLVGSLSDGANI
jgi:hypothetical protein